MSIEERNFDCNFFNGIFMLCKYFISNTMQVILIKFTMEEEIIALLLNATWLLKCSLASLLKAAVNLE